MKTLALKIEYDGKDFSGWQIQPEQRTVQGEIMKVLAYYCGEEVNLPGSGRTDAGVHARGQVAHAVLTEQFRIPENKIIQVMNSRLPDDIVISGARLLDTEFHSRFDAVKREYIYRICSDESVADRRFTNHVQHQVKLEKLQASADIFLGEHDFTAFSKHNPQTASYVCNVDICKWTQIDERSYQLRIRANRFVYGMVRAVTGAMLEISRGKNTIEETRAMLEAQDRNAITYLAPAKGLTLEKIYYPEDVELFG
ncbi:MAG: tRNA pseudouridine(38-40) synthase TruA [Candidatus Kapabacteria bacterium]|jgi:tRNA pseudouridine38-40 synthase|nr:tRNA pseudouridine(38-40) synthase TruA [Candidatus Kapabacteria bacterium]